MPPGNNAIVKYYSLIQYLNQRSRGSRGFFSTIVLKTRLIQNLYAPDGAIKTFKR